MKVFSERGSRRGINSMEDIDLGVLIFRLPERALADIWWWRFYSKFYTAGDLLSKRKLTIRYIIFYVLFLPDAWQVLTGLIAAYFLFPHLRLPDTGIGARALLFIMIGTIGYAASRIPARGVTQIFKKWILGDKRL
jgi:hypothetical protein